VAEPKPSISVAAEQKKTQVGTASVAEPAPEPPHPVATAAPPPVLNETKAPDTVPAEQPPSGSWLRLAPLQDYTRAATRAMHPAAPSAKILNPEAGPRITLPGPALPPELASPKGAPIVTVIGNEPPPAPRRLPGWLVTTVLVLGIPMAGAALMFYFQPVAHSSADTRPPVQEPAPAPAAQPVAAQAAQPLAQMIEVTGFRILVDFNKKSEIHYVVVNHSAADLSNVTVFVTVHDANAKAGQPPLCRFSFRAPGLGPYESKEMTSPIEKLTRSVSLPGWQDLRADVQVTQ
jgi:hypothetical protein